MTHLINNTSNFQFGSIYATQLINKFYSNDRVKWIFEDIEKEILESDGSVVIVFTLYVIEHEPDNQMYTCYVHKLYDDISEEKIDGQKEYILDGCYESQTFSKVFSDRDLKKFVPVEQ